MPYRPDEITLPDIYDAKEVAAFADSLNTQLDRFGVKKLRKASMSIYWHLKHVQKIEKEMKRLLRVVNGLPTDAQHQYYEEKKVKTAAERFYGTLSVKSLQTALLDEGSYWSDKVENMSRAALVTALVNAHVEKERDNAWGEAAQVAEESGYIGTEETEKLFCDVEREEQCP